LRAKIIAGQRATGRARVRAAQEHRSTHRPWSPAGSADARRRSRFFVTVR